MLVALAGCACAKLQVPRTGRPEDLSNDGERIFVRWRRVGFFFVLVFGVFSFLRSRFFGGLLGNAFFLAFGQCVFFLAIGQRVVFFWLLGSGGSLDFNNFSVELKLGSPRTPQKLKTLQGGQQQPRCCQQLAWPPGTVLVFWFSCFFVPGEGVTSNLLWVKMGVFLCLVFGALFRFSLLVVFLLLLLCFELRLSFITCVSLSLFLCVCVCHAFRRHGIMCRCLHRRLVIC